MSIEFPQKLSLARLPTPLEPLPRISAGFEGPTLWLKRDDLTEFAAGGNKIRKLEYLLADALANGATCVITCGGVQSNHCRATALIAAKLGLKCHLILRGNEPDLLEANTFLGALAGATLAFHRHEEFARLDDLFAFHAERLASSGERPYCIPTGGSNEVGIWGYLEAGFELYDNLAARQLSNCLVCCATGSGGTHAGLALASHLVAGPDVRAYAVCDNKEYFATKALADIRAWHSRYHAVADLPQPSLDICDQYIGPGYAKAYPDLLETIALAAQAEGLILDPVYTGKAFHGMLTQLRAGKMARYDNVVFVHTGGTFGLFPYNQAFSVHTDSWGKLIHRSSR